MLGVNVNAGDLKVSFNVNLTQDDGKESQEPKERKHPLTSRGECSELGDDDGFCGFWKGQGSWEDSKSGRRVLLLPSSDPWGKLKISFFRIPVDNMSCISLSLDEKKALRKVKEVFRNSQRSIPNLDRSNGRTRQPVTKVYNHDFANRTSQHFIWYISVLFDTLDCWCNVEGQLNSVMYRNVFVIVVAFVFAIVFVGQVLCTQHYEQISKVSKIAI